MIPHLKTGKCIGVDGIGDHRMDFQVSPEAVSDGEEVANREEAADREPGADGGAISRARIPSHDR